jgi:hypothetical protein
VRPVNTNTATLLIAAAAITLTACGGQTPEDGGASTTTDAAELARLRTTVDALERRKTRLEDERQVKRLQHAFGYYIDRGLWDEAAELFADDGTIEIGLDGVYVGRERVREYLYAFGGGESGLPEGRLNEHLQIMPVITVAEDGASALGRWRAIILGGELGGEAYWGEGPYENRYVKDNGIWKIDQLHWYQTVVVPYEDGWQFNDDLNGGIWVSDRLPPDRPPSVRYDTWPATYLPPFHFPNPVTGQRSTATEAAR